MSLSKARDVNYVKETLLTPSLQWIVASTWWCQRTVAHPRCGLSPLGNAYSVGSRTKCTGRETVNCIGGAGASYLAGASISSCGGMRLLVLRLRLRLNFGGLSRRSSGPAAWNAAEAQSLQLQVLSGQPHLHPRPQMSSISRRHSSCTQVCHLLRQCCLLC